MDTFNLYKVIKGNQVLVVCARSFAHVETLLADNGQGGPESIEILDHSFSEVKVHGLIFAYYVKD